MSDVTTPTMPAKGDSRLTLLYRLPPEGRGSADVESLFSLLCRLAYAHRVTPSKLVKVSMAEHPEVHAALSPSPRAQRWMRKIHQQGWGWGWGWDKDDGKLMLGTGDGAKNWVRALEIATGLTGLSQCTLFKLNGQVSSTKLITDEERVCPECLSDDQTTGRLPHARLLWRLGPVACCPIHRRHLVKVQCGRPASEAQDAYHRVKHPGVCSQCGSIGFRCLAAASEEADAGEVWRAEQCAALLVALSGEWSESPAAMKSLVSQRLDALGGVQDMAKRVGTSKSLISRWLNTPTARISMAQLIDIAAVEGISLASLLQGVWEPVEVPAGYRVPHRVRRTPKRIDHTALREAMKAGVESGLSVSQIARTMQVDLSTMKRHKELYKCLRGRNVTQRQIDDDARRWKAVAEAEHVAVALKSAGKTLSLRNAGAVTGDRWLPAQLRSMVLQEIVRSLEEGSAHAKTRLGPQMLLEAAAAADRVRGGISFA